jgi:hypothetical protein
MIMAGLSIVAPSRTLTCRTQIEAAALIAELASRLHLVRFTGATPADAMSHSVPAASVVAVCKGSVTLLVRARDPRQLVHSTLTTVDGRVIKPSVCCPVHSVVEHDAHLMGARGEMLLIGAPDDDDGTAAPTVAAAVPEASRQVVRDVARGGGRRCVAAVASGKRCCKNVVLASGSEHPRCWCHRDRARFPDFLG